MKKDKIMTTTEATRRMSEAIKALKREGYGMNESFNGYLSEKSALKNRGRKA